MFEIETHEYSKANLERLAFYYEDTFNKLGYRHH